jgi:DNA-binding transcriptional LysR family regulator
VGLREGGSAAQLRRLRASRIEVAIIAIGGGLSYDLDGLASEVLLHGTPRLAVAAGHPLADRDWVNVADLEHETWIVGEAGSDGPQFGPWPTLRSEPRIAYALRDWPARLGLVAAGVGVALIPSLLTEALGHGIKALRVEDPRPLRRDVLAVTRAEPSGAAGAMVAALRRAAATLEDGTA